MAGKPLIRKVDAFRLPVTDLDSAIAFYEKLGHGLIWRNDEGAGLKLGEGDTELVLHTVLKEKEPDLLVDSADEAAVRFVEAGGRVLHGPFDIAVGRCVVVGDPWGNVLSLLDLSKGTFVTDHEGNVTGIQPKAPL